MLLELLLPSRCAGCGTRGAPVCADCTRLWGSLAEVTRAPLPVPAYALAPYHSAAKRILLTYKERGRRDLAPALGRALATALLALPGSVAEAEPGTRSTFGAEQMSKARWTPAAVHVIGSGRVPEPRPSGSSPPNRAGPADRSAARREPTNHIRLQTPLGGTPSATPIGGHPPLCLVPVPSRRVASRVRGGPHVQRIAEEAARLIGDVQVAPALALDGGRDSVGLSRTQRIRNLEGRLRFVPGGRPPPGARVVLIDDVITTGTTSATCVTTLATAGVPVAAVVALLVAG